MRSAITVSPRRIRSTIGDKLLDIPSASIFNPNVDNADDRGD
jgi:hypothetical protein